MTKAFLAVDTSRKNEAFRWIRTTVPPMHGVKVGIEFVSVHGMSAVVQIIDYWNVPVLLDLKLWDIETTVARTVKSILDRVPNPWGITIRASCTKAAVDAANGRTKVIAVSTMTDLATYDDPPIRSLKDGAAGVVCAARHAGTVLRIATEMGLDRPITISPGIRAYVASRDDHASVTTPAQAKEYGVDWIVVGRPITTSPDPQAAAKHIVEQLG
jgi:orotidine-5'-phosphate decarboxylase